MVGEGEFKYELIEGWGQLPEGYRLGGNIPGVATDSRDRVYVLNRGDHPVIVFDHNGQFLGSWGEGAFSRPHGITITPDDLVWCTDDLDHTVRKFTLDGTLLQTLGTKNQPSDTGYDGTAKYHVGSIKRSAGPFNRPTKVALAPNGDLYITDGYGNARVHRFTATGDLIQSWGEPGDQPGQFNLPHNAWVHTDGRVFVCDRENFRVQIFSATGELLNIWRMAGRPAELCIDADNHVFVASLESVEGRYTLAGQVMAESYPSNLSIRDLEGNLLAQWGDNNPGEPNSFLSAHGMCLDSRGSIYVAEIAQSVMRRKGLALPHYPALRKYARV